MTFGSLPNKRVFYVEKFATTHYNYSNFIYNEINWKKDSNTMCEHGCNEMPVLCLYLSVHYILHRSA